MTDFNVFQNAIVTFSVMLLRSCLSDGLGVDMYDASESGDVMPRALEPDELETEANDIAELINKMTSYAPGDRPSAQYVHELLCKISAKVYLIFSYIILHSTGR